MGQSYGSLVAETMARRLEQFGVTLPGRVCFSICMVSFLLLVVFVKAAKKTKGAMVFEVWSITFCWLVLYPFAQTQLPGIVFLDCRCPERPLWSISEQMECGFQNLPATNFRLVTDCCWIVAPFHPISCWPKAKQAQAMRSYYETSRVSQDAALRSVHLQKAFVNDTDHSDLPRSQAYDICRCIKQPQSDIAKNHTQRWSLWDGSIVVVLRAPANMVPNLKQKI